MSMGLLEGKEFTRTRRYSLSADERVALYRQENNLSQDDVWCESEASDGTIELGSEIPNHDTVSLPLVIHRTV